MPKVKCEVDSCTHWVPGQFCAAGNIDILHEEEGRMSEHPEHTQCKTFYRRGGAANYLGSADNVNWTGVAADAFLPGQQTNPEVTCVVDSCRYWAKGDRCDADGIEVAGQAADESQDTNCATFKRRIGN